MTGLLLNIQNAGNQHENVTSNVLAEMLNRIPACKKAFLELLKIPDIDSGEVGREISLSDEHGRVDFIASGNDWIAVIENKPWGCSSPTIDGQLTDYAKWLEKQTDKQSKFLFLLTTENQRVDSALLKEKFGKMCISFDVYTWKQVLDVFDKVEPKHDALDLWINTLKDYFPPEKAEYSPDNWESIKERIKQTVSFLTGIGISVYGFKLDSQGGARDDSSYCWYLNDATNRIQYAIHADNNQKDHQVHPFVIRTCSGWNKTSDRRLAVEPSILKNVGFMESSKNTYDCSLVDSTNEVTPEKLAKNVIRIMNAVRDAIAFSVK